MGIFANNILNMADRLHSMNISIDTAFFEAQNFLVGSKIAELSSLSLKYSVKLYMTDITYREILDRFHKNLIKTKEEITKPVGLVVDKAKLLRNFPAMISYFELPTFDVDVLFDEFRINFDEWIKTNHVIILQTHHLTIKDVFDDYFKNKSPFKEGKKKHEFPDAFTLKALVEFFERTKEKTYLLSSDNDILEYKHKTIIPIQTKDTAEIFDLIISKVSEKMEKKARKFIVSEFEISKIRLLEDIKDEIYKVIENEVNNKLSYGNLEIDGMDDLKITNLEYKKFSIPYLDIDKNEAGIECEVSFNYDVSYYADDYSEAIYDKEDDIHLGVQSGTYSIENKCTIPIDIGVTFDLEGDVEFEIESINYGHDLDVFDELSEYY